SVLGSTMANQREFEEVMKLVFMGRLKPVVDRVFPLKDARAAHESLGRGEQFGKVVLAIPSFARPDAEAGVQSPAVTASRRALVVARQDRNRRTTPCAGGLRRSLTA